MKVSSTSSALGGHSFLTFEPCDLTEAVTHQLELFQWTKISSPEIIIFELTNDGKKWSRISKIFYA